MAARDRNANDPDEFDDDRWDDHDDPLEADQDDGPDGAEEVATDLCGVCGREIIADVVQCPHCGEYAPVSGGPRSSTWVRTTAISLVGLFALWILWTLLR